MKPINRSPVKIALIVLLVAQFFLISFSNLTLIDKNLDCDNSKLFVHAAEIWKQKTLLLPAWDYPNTLEWDCSSILAIPFYGITHNIYLAFGLSNIIFLCCFLGVIFFLLRGEDLLCPLLCANLLIIPFRVGMLDYYNMLLFCGGQYIIKVCIPLLLAGLVIHIEQRDMLKCSEILINFLMAVYLGLHFLSAVSSGIYVTLCGVLPIFAVYIGYKFFRWEKIPNKILFLIGTSGILSLIGLKVNTTIMGGAKGNGVLLCSVYEIHETMISNFWGMFELFGGLTNRFGIQILSMDGVNLLAKFCLVLLMLGYGIICVAKCVRKKGSLRNLLLISIFIWNIFVLVISYTRYGSPTSEYRYHLIGMLPLMCVTGSLLLNSIQKLQKKQQTFLYGAGILAILFLCAVSYKDLYTRGEQNADLKELCAYVKDLDVDCVYLFDNSSDAEICRAIDDSKQYIYLLGGGHTWTYDYYNSYVDALMQTKNVIVAVREEQYQFGDRFEIAGYGWVKFDKVANRVLYRFEE